MRLSEKIKGYRAAQAKLEEFRAKDCASDVFSDNPMMSYAYYHEIKRGTTPKTAPSYVEVKNEIPGGGKVSVGFKVNAEGFLDLFISRLKE